MQTANGTADRAIDALRPARPGRASRRCSVPVQRAPRTARVREIRNTLLSSDTVPLQIALHHVTQYRYDRAVALGPQLVRLRPAAHYRGSVMHYALSVEPAAHFLSWQRDAFANYEARLLFPDKTTTFRVSVDLTVDLAEINPFDFLLEPDAVQMPLTYQAALRESLAPYLQPEPAGPQLQHYLQHYLQATERRGMPTTEFLVNLNRRLQQDIRYLVRLEPGVQTTEDTLRRRSGSCRDSGWLLVQLLRHCGLAARFVSGYLIQQTSEEIAHDDLLERRHGHAGLHAELHAWCEVYLPGAGWIGLDPTSGLLTAEGHIPLACAPDPSQAAPVEGRVEACEVAFSHQISVRCDDEALTPPHTD